jgi:hypothetical protein
MDSINIRRVGLHSLPGGVRIGYVDHTNRTRTIPPATIRRFDQWVVAPHSRGCVRLVARTILPVVISWCFGVLTAKWYPILPA